MHFNFTPVSLDGLDEYYRLWDLCPLHSLDYSPVNLWGWQEHYGLPQGASYFVFAGVHPRATRAYK